MATKPREGMYRNRVTEGELNPGSLDAIGVVVRLCSRRAQGSRPLYCFCVLCRQYKLAIFRDNKKAVDVLPSWLPSCA